MVGMSKAKAENRALPKRFYREVTVADGEVLLDGKRLRTAAKQPMVLRSALAEAVAAEWRAQETHIDPDAMPLTRLVNITLDRVPHDRAALLLNAAAYGESDLLCYRDAAPELAARQAKHFNPVLDWAAQQGVKLNVTEGVMPVTQPTESLHRLHQHLAVASDSELAALAMMVPLLGSALLAWAVWQGALTIEDALNAARLDEEFQAEKWGRDAEAEAAWAPKARDLRAAAFFLTHNGLN